MVTKNKDSDSKYVMILAQSVIKPLIHRFLEGTENKSTEQKPVNSVLVRGKEVKLVKCPFCDKTSYSAPGMKKHITKMHKDIEVIHSLEINNHDGEEKKEKDLKRKPNDIFDEANKVIDLLNDDVVDIDDDNEELFEEVQEPALDETFGEIN